MAGAGAGAIKAGEAFVAFFVEDNAFYRGLDKAGAKFKSWGAGLTNIGAALGAAGTGVLAPFVASLTQAVERASGLQQLSDRLGESITSLSTLSAGFESVGVASGGFEKAIEDLQIRIHEAADANLPLLGNLKSLGTGMQLVGKSSKEMLYLIADAIGRITDPIDKLRALRELRLPDQVLKALKGGRAGVDKLMEGGESGTLTAAQGSQAVAITEAMNKGWTDLKNTFMHVGLALLPTAVQITDMQESFKKGLATVRSWIRENKAVIVAAAGVGVALVATGTAFVALGTVVTGTGVMILTTVALIKGAFALLLSPIGLAVAALGGLGYVFATQTETGKKATASMKEAFGRLGEDFKSTWGGISDAIQANEWGLATDIAVGQMKIIWIEFRNWFVNLWEDMVASVGKEIYSIADHMKTFKENSGLLGLALPGPLQALRPLLGTMAEGIPDDIGKDPGLERGRAAERAKQKADADAARASLAGLTAKAGAAKNSAAFRSILDALMQGIIGWLGSGPGGRSPAMLPLAEHVKGVMGSTNAAIVGQQLGYGDSIPQQQLDAQRNIMSNTSQVPQMAQDLNVLARGGRMGP